ncbi:hypothetical protein PNF1_900 (plasmid) [Nocardia farcinica IFM 10152]|uniref:Uncharacterized protein n=1 Tax=Nocardia farcinica (strain IFM 10152) TaxID=247156 RepID=Q5YMH6_NOCFA|nr:hypothetical protein PNF1_900 [Nocardia farcinica IFM 10152]
MSRGRAAVQPALGYRTPQRLFLGHNECRVRFFPENGGDHVDLDFMCLPVPRELRNWFATAAAGATRPSGPRRTATSASDIVSTFLRFARYLAGLDNPPLSPNGLRAVHLDGYILSGGVGTTLHRDLATLRSVLRFAPDVPAEFAARLSTARVAKNDERETSYTEAEFNRILAHARSQLRAAARRIRAANRLLEHWRADRVDQVTDAQRWELGWLLDYVDREGDVPRAGAVQPAAGKAHQAAVVSRHGGSSTVLAHLYPTYLEIGAAVALMIGLTGHNLGTIRAATVHHHRTDADTGAAPTILVDWLKPRRGTRRAAMTVPLQDLTPDGARPAGRDDLTTPFGLYTLLLELGHRVRAKTGSDGLFVAFTHKGNGKGRDIAGFRVQVPKSILLFWGEDAKLPTDIADPDTSAPAVLRVRSRRLRLTFLERYQRPVAHTEITLVNEYLARNRGNLAEYQQVVADVLSEQVAKARTAATIPVLSSEDIAQARTDPAGVAARFGVSAQTLTELVDGRLDTVVAGCTDNLNSPHSPPGKPCQASFLLCLSCPCARATPAHLPVQVLVHDALLARRPGMTPLTWAERFADPATRLLDLLEQHTTTAVADARANASRFDRLLVDRFLTHGLDLQ